jgi:hypothetical protein
MGTAVRRLFSLSFLCVLCFISFVQAARVSRYDVPFNLDWRFITGDNPSYSAAAFNDASWATVSVPHSASYTAPTHSAEQGAIGATVASYYWYRKKFVCPANARKVFIHFGAIMQTATVYINGTSVGTHDRSGYTGFFFDISNYVVRGDSTSIAVRCYVATNADIPPGGNGGSSPDFELWSGMYRDVFLCFKDSVYVPIRGQRIMTTGTTGSPSVRAITTVRNDAAAAKSITVLLTLRNAGGATVATQTATSTVNAGSSYNFDMTSGTVASPTLWSPSNPYRYSLETRVSEGTVLKDSVVEKIGLRFFSWSTGRFSLNGTVTELYGVCMAQFMGWVLNAVPDSRFARQVAYIKAMGINSIRDAHYPRAQGYYDACDSLGMLVYDEVPTWGVDGGFATRTNYWPRLYSCDTAMVLDGFNHPCIYAWGLFNEQNENLNTFFDNQRTIIHNLDPQSSATGRPCCVANYANAGTKWTGDIHAENYTTGITGLNTEAYGNAMNDANEYGNWFRNYVRGSTANVSDASGTSDESAQEVACMQNHYWLTNDNMGGGHFWCFMDYSSGRNTTGREGIVDRLWLPKQVYFRFKNILTGGATDYWASGTATQLALTTDITSLRADGADLALITATLRNASGACTHMACNITFTVTTGASSVAMLYTGHSTGPTSGASAVTCAVEGGRAGCVLRTSRIAGAIVVTATSSCGLTQTTVPLNSSTVTEPVPPLVWGGVGVQHGLQLNSQEPQRLKTVYTAKGVALSFPSGAEKKVRIIDCQGREAASFTLKNATPVYFGRSNTGSGIFYAVWNDNGRRLLTRLAAVR